MNIDENNVEQTEINKIDEPAASIEDVKAEESKNEQAPPEQSQSDQTSEVKEAPTSETAETSKSETSDDDSESPSYQSKINEIFDVLRQKLEKNEPIEVLVKSRIKGGFRVVYEDIPMFLPASHFSLKKTPTEAELQDAVGTVQKVLVHELQEFDEGRKAVIVTKKPMLREEFYSNLKEGDKVKGVVSSIASFGVFLDLGGIEGLIHISRLSQVHVDDPSSMFNKGDEIEAIVTKIDQENDRIGLSRKELEASPWKGVAQEFSPGTQHKGIVRRLTDFGAYVELRPGVDGLLRTPEISWTKRIKKPSDVFSPNQEILVEVLNVSEEKETVALSYKKTQPNPWLEMKEKYPINSQANGIVSQVMPQGVIVTLNDEVDGFMPRSKMKDLMQGKKIPYNVKDDVEVIIADLIPEEESLILTPVIDEEALEASRQKRFGSKRPAMDSAKSQGGITLLDMISDSQKKDLFKSVNE
jgi:small subunit ribosomal protein S1